MAYIKYKEISKYFYFSKKVKREEIPKYVYDYINEDETLLVGYKTMRDFGVFTDQKMVLFDNKMIGSKTREIFIISYNRVSTISIIFKSDGTDLLLITESGYPLRLKFVKTNGLDKKRLRLLYNIISARIANQKVNKDVINTLINDDIKFE